MKYRLPSLRVQILVLVLALLTAALLFIRSFFIYGFESFQEELHTEELKESITTMYHDICELIPPEQEEAFRDTVRTLLRDVEQINLTGTFFVDEMTLYSTFIFVFLVLVVISIFVFSSSLILRPLRRLQEGTQELARGNFDIQVSRTRVPEVNDLVTSFNQMIRDLAESRRRLVQVERDLLWREIARIMAHEIKNPLTPIRLSAERLEMQYQDRDTAFDRIFHDSISVIQEEVDNLQLLVNRFRDFAHMPLPQIAPFDLQELLEEVIRSCSERAQVSLELAGDFRAFTGDRMQWREVFVNLLENAIQAAGSAAQITINGIHEADSYRIQVEDNGTGIDPEHLEKVFDPYFTRRREGTGLGLAVVRRIVQMHNGDIYAESPPGAGATFTIVVQADLTPDGKPDGVEGDGNEDPGN
ncbi:HAMP domain-containing histidine kinase [bacterium]|nr:HAMP domain-containing histidine kinase [bacterium]